MKKYKGAIVWGVLLICFGVLLTLNELNVIRLTSRYFLPILFYGLSLGFHVGFIVGGRRTSGLLVPGGILLTYGTYFLLAALGISRGWWPLFILGPAVGLFEEYIFGRGRNSGSMIAVFVLTAISGFFLLQSKTHVSFWLFMGGALLVLGVALLIGALARGRGRDEHAPIHAEPPHTPPPPQDEAKEEPKVYYEITDDPQDKPDPSAEE